MSHRWPMVSIGDLLSLRDPDVDVTPEAIYPFAGVYCFGRGLFAGERRSGLDTSYRKLTTLKEGDFVYPKLMAWEGAFAVVSPEHDGLVVSTEFPVFSVNRGLVLPAYLHYYFKIPSVWSSLAGSSPGTNVRRRRLNPTDFLRSQIPLPPLAEQRRLVARIDELVAKIDEARSLKRSTKEESRRLWKTLSRMARGTNFPVRSLDSMVEFLDGRRIPLSEAQRSSRKGPYPYYGASGVIDGVDDYIFDEDLLLLSEDGANLINRSTPIAFIATGRYWVNNHAHVLRPVPGVADIRFLEYALSDYDVSVFNFASAQAKLNQANARRIAFPLPPLKEQVRIVRHLDLIRQKVSLLLPLQEATHAELNALPLAVLDQAFKGNL